MQILTVLVPIAKAATSVTDVTVMDTPACFKANDMRMGIESCFSSTVRLSSAFNNTIYIFKTNLIIFNLITSLLMKKLHKNAHFSPLKNFWGLLLKFYSKNENKNFKF